MRYKHVILDVKLNVSTVSDYCKKWRFSFVSIITGYMLPQNKKNWEKNSTLYIIHESHVHCAGTDMKAMRPPGCNGGVSCCLFPLDQLFHFLLPPLPLSQPFVWPLIQVCIVYIQGIFSRLVSQTTSFTTLHIMIRIELLVKSDPGHRREFFQCCK